MGSSPTPGFFGIASPCVDSSTNLQKPLDCLNCPLYNLGDGFVPAFGTGRRKIALVGMAPEVDEVAKREPFVGRAGSVLGLALKIAGLSKTDFYIINTLQCRPPDMHLSETNPWLSGAIDHCKVHRDKVLTQPLDAIIALGNTPFKMLTGESGIAKKRGYVYWSEEYQTKVIGSFHPSYIGRGKSGLIQALIYDIKVAPTKPLPEIPFQKLTLHPTIDDFRSWCLGVSKAEFLAVDIETPYSPGHPEDEDLEDDVSSQIIRCSFGLPDGRAVTFPWMGEYVEIAKTALATQTNKVFWNADYDVPRLEFNSCPVNGIIIDAMWLFHFLFPNLPRSLTSVSTYYTTLPEWKSLSTSDPELYSTLDSHATVLNFLGIRSHLQKENMWQVAWDHVVRLQAVLRKMHQRGVMVDRVALSKFQEVLSTDLATLQVKLNQMIPDQIKPKIVIKAKHLRGRCSCVHHAVGKHGAILKRLVSQPDCVVCAGSGWNPIQITPDDFNANSSDQVKDLAHYLGHRLAVRKVAGEKKETTEKKFLIQLGRQHPEAPYMDILQYRKVAKMRDTYTNWPLQIISETRAKAMTKLTLVPKTGRLSSVNPNMQNIPKEGPLAKQFKHCLIASPGHIICKRDYSGIEAVLTGYFANDSTYMRLATAGVHSYNVARFKGIPVDLHLSDEELAKYLKTLKSEQHFDEPAPGEDVSLYQRFKKANHMINYGARHVKLFNESPGVFKDLRDAYRIWKFIFALNPRLKKWHQEIKQQILKEHRIMTPYMYNQWFWDVADLNEAIAMNPQSTAAAIIKEAMLMIDETEAGQYMILQVHDELAFDFPLGPGSCECHPDNQRTWQELDEEVRVIMERSLPLLGGLVIRTDRAEGKDFAA